MAERALKLELFCIPQPATLSVMVGVRRGDDFRYLNVQEQHAADPKVWAHLMEVFLTAFPGVVRQIDPKQQPAE